MALCASSLASPIDRFPILNPSHSQPLFLRHREVRFSPTASASSARRILKPLSPGVESPEQWRYLELPTGVLRRLAASAILFLGLSLSACSAAASAHIPPPTVTAKVDSQSVGQSTHDNGDVGECEGAENFEDKELESAFEAWKSKTYALTVPLRIVALRSSIPPSWVKDFMQSQGRRVKLISEFRGSLEEIFSNLSMQAVKGNVDPKSAMAADLISVGDSWLNLAITKALIEPIHGAEEQEWFQGLSEKWKVHLRRNSEGKLDSKGEIWAAPYRWGSMVIAYKKNAFQKHNLAPIESTLKPHQDDTINLFLRHAKDLVISNGTEDWEDLWQPQLAGKISMIDSPREVVGLILKCLGASYNTNDIESKVPGGRNAVQKKLTLLERQVRLFDSVHYLKAFGVGDVWVAVGWSSDVIPAAKRMSNVAVIVPKSGTSLWADLWAIPAASRIAANRIGGRVRGPSPLVHQWIEFCLQAARALPFKQEVIPGASPSAIECGQAEEFKELTKGKPRLDTNLVAGVIPSDILARCEFLEPLSDAAFSDYQWLISSMQKPRGGWVYKVQQYVSSMIQNFWPKLRSKVA